LLAFSVCAIALCRAHNDLGYYKVNSWLRRVTISV